MLVNEGDLLALLRRETSFNESADLRVNSDHVVNQRIMTSIAAAPNVGGRKQHFVLREAESIEREILFYIRQHKNSEKLRGDSELIWEQSTLSTIASMTESLVWLKSKIASLCEPLSAYQARTESLRSEGIGLGKTKLDKQADFSSILTDPLQSLSDRCMYALKIEFRCHALYFLESIRNSSYYCDEEPTKPEKFVADLNRDLMRADEKLSRYLSVEKKRYVFAGLPYTLSLLVIDGLSKLVDKRVNKNGLLRMTRNIFSMQQTMTNILTASEQCFDRARQYWELLLEEVSFSFASNLHIQSFLTHLKFRMSRNMLNSILSNIRSKNIELYLK